MCQKWKKFTLPLVFFYTGKFLCIHTRQDIRRNNLKVYILAMGNYAPRIVIENVLSQLTICKTSHRRILETMTTWWIQILSAISADRQFCSIPFHYLNNEGNCAVSQKLICGVNIQNFCEYCYMWMLCMYKVFLFSVSKLPMNQEAVIFGQKLAFLPNVVKLLNVILLIGPSWLPTVGLMLVQRSRSI